MSADLHTGQDTSVAVLIDGDLEARLDGFTSADITFDMTLIETRRLGAKADDFHSVFKGMTLALKSNVTGEVYLDVARFIVERAQRKSGAKVRFDITTTIRFEDGVFRAITVKDVEFESIPLSIPAGDELITLELNGKASGFYFD